MVNSRPRTCTEIRQYLKGASYRVAWNTCLVCVVYGGRDFDPISSSCRPCMNGWTCDPIWRRIGTTSSAPTSGPQHFFRRELYSVAIDTQASGFHYWYICHKISYCEWVTRISCIDKVRIVDNTECSTGRSWGILRTERSPAAGFMT